jgi:hypothetical protein
MRRVVFWLYANVSEEHRASIFRTDAGRTLCFSETLAYSRITAGHNGPQGHHLLYIHIAHFLPEYYSCVIVDENSLLISQYNGVCYNEQFLSIKSGCYNENRCYNECGGP